MDPIRKILVPVDFSECSRAAVEQAAWVARKSGGELRLLHVWQSAAFLAPDAGGGAPAGSLALAEMMHGNAQQQLSRFVDELSLQGVTVSSAWCENGVPSQVIIDQAKKGQIDLLVMGTHGLTGLEHALMGSVVEKVLRRAPCPVLSVRAGLPGGSPRDIRRILVPVDYSEGSKLALDAAVGLASQLGAEATAVHVWDRPSWVSDTITVQTGGAQRPLGALIHENEEKQMQDFLASLPGTTAGLPHRLLSGEPASAILKELDEGGYDLGVVATHGRGGLKHLLLGSVTEKLVRLAKVPMLTVPPPHKRRA